ncbi:9779_t:CDS:2, partial [Funneliformis caledonium]
MTAESSLDPSFGFGFSSTNKALSYTKCIECGIQTRPAVWCKHCDLARLREHFRNWTSGDLVVDQFLDFLEWIYFDQFVFEKNINKRGAFSTIYFATWMEGPKWKLDEEAETWERNGLIKVILKRLDNSQNMCQEYINQRTNIIPTGTGIKDVITPRSVYNKIYSRTKGSISSYMFVMRYNEQGYLYEYFELSIGLLCWKDIIDMLWSIAGLNDIHEAGLVHGHIYGGNILVENEADSIYSRIADYGFHEWTSEYFDHPVTKLPLPQIGQEADIGACYSVGKHSFCLLIGEAKNEIGEGHGCSYIQACASYAKQIGANTNNTIRKNLNPSFILYLSGPYLGIAGA